MEILTALVLRFDVPPQSIIASAILFLAYLALLGSLLTFGSIATGLYASAKRVRAQSAFGIQFLSDKGILASYWTGLVITSSREKKV